MLSYKQARAHALSCGILGKGMQAVPVWCMKRPRILARDVIHPETMESFLLANTLVDPEFIRMMALHSGIDYIVCYK